MKLLRRSCKWLRSKFSTSTHTKKKNLRPCYYFGTCAKLGTAIPITPCGLVCMKHIFQNIMFELNSLRDLHVLKLAVIQVPASLKMRLACTSGVAEQGWGGGCLFCWSVFNESDHAERIWPLARRGPVITTSCFPFFHPVHYWTNNLWGEKRMYLPSSFSLVLFSLRKAALCKVSILWLENNKLATVRAGL